MFDSAQIVKIQETVVLNCRKEKSDSVVTQHCPSRRCKKRPRRRRKDSNKKPAQEDGRPYQKLLTCGRGLFFATSIHFETGKKAGDDISKNTRDCLAAQPFHPTIMGSRGFKSHKEKISIRNKKAPTRDLSLPTQASRRICNTHKTFNKTHHAKHYKPPQRNSPVPKLPFF